MYSRKLALSLAKQYRSCPPHRIREDPGQEASLKRHRAVCPYCAGSDFQDQEAWHLLGKELKRKRFSTQNPDAASGLRPGQLCFVKSDLSMWRGHYFYNPPLVLITKESASMLDDVLVAQTYHDVYLAGPEDLIVPADDSPLDSCFVECWNIYTMKAAHLGPPLGRLSERILKGVLTAVEQPDFHPEWAGLPRPFSENDPRRFFRELELEVAYTFSSQSVSELLEDIEAPPLKLVHGSPAALQSEIRRTIPGIRWMREPRSIEEALCLAELPADRLPLAAEDDPEHKQNANLIRIGNGRVESFDPVDMVIYGRSGALTVSGRITGLPKDLTHSRLIAFLEPEEGQPISPGECEWKEETGDFLIVFPGLEHGHGRLKAAVVFETEKA